VLVWDMGVAGAVGNLRVKTRLGAWIFRIEKFAGAMLALFGVFLVVD
jgi:hypothetical protein